MPETTPTGTSSQQTGTTQQTTVPTQPVLPPELNSVLVNQNGQWGLKTVVDKVEGFVPLDYVRASIQKLSAADQRLAQAAETVKQNQTAITFYKDTIAGMNGDQDAAKRALEMLGMDEGEINTPPSGHTGRQQTQQQPTVDPSIQEMARVFKTIREKYNVDPVDVFGTMVNQSRNAAQDYITNEAMAIAKQDPVLASILADASKAPLLAKELRGQVTQAVRDGAPDGPQTYVPIIREMSAKYKALGIQPATSKPTVEETLNRFGLGPASSAGVGTVTGLENNERPAPVSPIKAKPGEYARNFTARLTHDLAQALSQQEAVA